MASTYTKSYPSERSLGDGRASKTVHITFTSHRTSKIVHRTFSSYCTSKTVHLTSASHRASKTVHLTSASHRTSKIVHLTFTSHRTSKIVHLTFTSCAFHYSLLTIHYSNTCCIKNEQYKLFNQRSRLIYIELKFGIFLVL